MNYFHFFTEAMYNGVCAWQAAARCCHCRYRLACPVPQWHKAGVKCHLGQHTHTQTQKHHLSFLFPPSFSFFPELGTGMKDTWQTRVLEEMKFYYATGHCPQQETFFLPSPSFTNYFHYQKFAGTRAQAHKFHAAHSYRECMQKKQQQPQAGMHGRNNYHNEIGRKKNIHIYEGWMIKCHDVVIFLFELFRGEVPELLFSSSLGAQFPLRPGSVRSRPILRIPSVEAMRFRCSFSLFLLFFFLFFFFSRTRLFFPSFSSFSSLHAYIIIYGMLLLFHYFLFSISSSSSSSSF